MVPAILFLWDGREQTRQRGEFLDPAHGFYHPHSQYVGDHTEGMERGKPKDENHLYRWYCDDHRLGDRGGYRQFNEINSLTDHFF